MKLKVLILAFILAFWGCNKKGCTDKNALNYDASATKENGLCTYYPENISPIIVVNSPGEVSEVFQNNTFKLDLVIYDIARLSDLKIKVLNPKVGAALYAEEISLTDFSKGIKKEIALPKQKITGILELKIEATNNLGISNSYNKNFILVDTTIPKIEISNLKINFSENSRHVDANYSLSTTDNYGLSSLHWYIINSNKPEISDTLFSDSIIFNTFSNFTEINKSSLFPVFDDVSNGLYFFVVSKDWDGNKGIFLSPKFNPI